MQKTARAPRTVLALGCTLLLTATCGPKQPAPDTTTKASPRARPKPRPRPSDAPERLQLIWADIQTALETAGGNKTLLGPILKKYVKTKIPKRCTGDVASDLFSMIKVPTKHADLPRAKLKPGFMVFLRGKKNTGGISGPDAQNEDERRLYTFELCSITIRPAKSDGTLMIHVQHLQGFYSGHHRFKESWREHPPGTALMTLEVTELAPASETDDHNGPDTESVVDHLFAYVSGRFHWLNMLPRQSGYTPVGKITYLSVGKPLQHLVVFSTTSQTEKKKPTGGTVKHWKRTHEITRWNKKTVALDKVKGAALKKLLQQPQLDPYRKPLSGVGDPPD